MNEEQRDRILRDLASLVHIMYIQCPKALNLDIARKLRERVDSRLRLAPVEAFLPVRSQTADVRKWHAVLPPSLIELVWEPRELEPLSQLDEGFIRDGDRECILGRGSGHAAGEIGGQLQRIFVGVHRGLA